VAVLRHWRHLLVGTSEPVIVLTGYSNLQYYHHLQKINRRVARYINFFFLEDFNYQLKHVPGMCNHTNALSRRLDHDDGSVDNDQVVALADLVFARAVLTAMLDERIISRQKAH
jgi:hypothetical protein